MKNKFVITVVGRDTVGIIAKVCTYLADHQVNKMCIRDRGERNCSLSEIWRMFKNYTGTSGCEKLLYYES